MRPYVARIDEHRGGVVMPRRAASPATAALMLTSRFWGSVNVATSLSSNELGALLTNSNPSSEIIGGRLFR